jgi:hypothetical protein
MSELFPHPPAHDFEDVLRNSFNRVIDEIALEPDLSSQSEKKTGRKRKVISID